MSKNISIQEGGQGKAFGRIQKLKIAQSGGGDTLWVPEEEVRTKSLYVSKNGTYLASSEDVYGYDEVDVNITNGVTYTDDDVDYYIGVDDDGYLEEPEAIPSYIEITTPPDKTSYIVGEPINTKGMVVTAYYGDGTEYGVIPREEYTIDPIVAVGGSGDEYTDGQGLNVLKIETVQHKQTLKLDGSATQYDYYHSWYPHTLDENRNIIAFDNAGATPSASDLKRFYLTKYNGLVYAYGLVSSNNRGMSYAPLQSSPLEVAGGVYTSDDGNIITQLTGTSFGIIVGEWRSTNVLPYFSGVPLSTVNPLDSDVSQLVATGCEVTVSWNREDGEALTTSFNVNVSAPPVPNIDTGGNSGGSSGGSW